MKTYLNDAEMRSARRLTTGAPWSQQQADTVRGLLLKALSALEMSSAAYEAAQRAAAASETSLRDRLAELRKNYDADIATMQMRVDMAREESAERLARAELAERDLRELRAIVNSPRVDEFFEAVRSEAAHQVERWGVEHDAGKRPEDWITLYMYLLGKAARAHFDGNRNKLLHHIITVAAVALNWHRNATGENTLMRPGVGPTEAA